MKPVKVLQRPASDVPSTIEEGPTFENPRIELVPKNPDAPQERRRAIEHWIQDGREHMREVFLADGRAFLYSEEFTKPQADRLIKLADSNLALLRRAASWLSYARIHVTDEFISSLRGDYTTIMAMADEKLQLPEGKGREMKLVLSIARKMAEMKPRKE